MNVIDQNLTVHAADLYQAFIPGDFHAFDCHRVFCFCVIRFNLNQFQSGAASTIAGGDNAENGIFHALLFGQRFERLSRFCGDGDHRTPQILVGLRSGN